MNQILDLRQRQGHRGWPPWEIRLGDDPDQGESRQCRHREWLRTTREVLHPSAKKRVILAVAAMGIDQDVDVGAPHARARGGFA